MRGEVDGEHESVPPPPPPLTFLKHIILSLGSAHIYAAIMRWIISVGPSAVGPSMP